VRTTTIDVALPVLNEDQTLETNVCRLVAELDSGYPYEWTISIVDNGSTDASWDVASRIARTVPRVRALRLAQRGRGRALKAAWTTSTADIVAYMDIDLSTDLSALRSLVDPIADGLADISIGSRLDPGSQVTRSARREIISHLYNWIARAILRYGVRDAQCGFKAISRKVVESIIPDVKDGSWFFDTELLVLATRQGLRINEVPVIWVEDHDSRVRIVTTAIDDLRGIWRLARHKEPPIGSIPDDINDPTQLVEIVPALSASPTDLSRSSSEGTPNSELCDQGDTDLAP
jgi:glycosyltransferase involved in cell wall biosynthesis